MLGGATRPLPTDGDMESSTYMQQLGYAPNAYDQKLKVEEG